jgi:hypothetical protein
MKLIDKDVRRDIAQSTRVQLGPMWGQALAAEVQTNMDALVLFEGAKVTPGNPAKVVAGGSRKALGDGLVPVEHARAFEFGAPSRIPHEDTYSRASDAGSHEVTRHTMRQLPKATKTGRVVYPAWAKVAPRMVSLWVQIIVRNIHESLEK